MTRAPVSGGEVGAKAASLTIMVGGPERAFAKVKPLFDLMGKNKKRASSPPRPGESGLLEQARIVAEAAFKDLQKHLPADLVKQVEKRVDQSQKTVQSGLKAIQVQLKAGEKQEITREWDK